MESLLDYPKPLPQIDLSVFKMHEKPNQYLVCGAGLCKNETPHMIAPVFEMNARDLRKAFQSVALNDTDVTLIHKDDEQRQDDYVARTKWMRYPDIVTAKFIDLDGGQSTFALYSRSVYGHSDFGVNEKRAKAWLEKLQKVTAKT